MRKITIIIILATLMISSLASAREDRIKLNIAEAFDKLSIQSQLEGVQMFFGDQTYPSSIREMSVIRTNRKTNAFGKSDKQACEWVFLSALLALKDSAISQGGNAVINIKSNYDNREFISSDEFQCGVGRIIAGVALIGQVASLGTDGEIKPSPKQKKEPKTESCTTKQILDMKNTGLTEDQIIAACG